MATQFYSRTLPTPRFVNVNGGTWTTLGVGDGGAAATIPPAYVEGDDTVYLVQIVLQRTSSAANIRFNLDTFISGSGGAAGPDFIPFVEDRGLIRLSYSGGSRVFDIAESAVDDTEEPYAWQFRGAENSAWMLALLTALVDDSTTPVTIELLVPDGTITVRATLGNPLGQRQRTGIAQGLGVSASVGRPKATVIGQAEGLSVNASVGAAEGYIGVGYAEGLSVEATVSRPDALAHPFAYIEYLHLEPLGVRSRTRSGGAVWEWNNLDLAIPYPVGDSTHITTVRVRADQFRITGPGNTLAGLGADFIRHGDLILYSPSAGEFHIDPLVGRFDSAGRIRLSGDEWDAWWTAFSADATNELTVEWFFHGLEPVVSVGRPEGVKDRTKYGLPQPIAQEAALGRPAAVRFGSGRPIAAEQAVGRPRGYVPKVAALPIAQEMATGRPHAFAHAEFILQEAAVGRPIARVKRAALPIAQEAAVGRPAAILYGVPGSTTAGATVTESHNFGRYTLIRPDANSTWQFNSNLTLPTPIMTSAASPIAQAHVRANQVRFIRTGGQNPGFSTAFNTRGRLTLTRVGGSSFTITGPNFDHLGRMDPSGLDGYSEWWTAFRGGGTLSQLEVTWELDAAGFIPFLAQEAAVGMPEGRTQVVAEPMAIAQEAVVGRPHAFAHAEFILQEAVVGRPRGYIPAVAARAIGQEAVVGRPHAFAHAEFILQEAVVGRPRGYIRAVAARTIAQEAAVGRPRGQTSRAAIPIVQEAAVGRPGVSTSRAARPIAAEQAVGRPAVSTSRAARAIAQEAAVGRPVALVRRAVRAIGQEAAVGRPRGYVPKVAAIPIAQEMALRMPDGVKKRFAVGRAIGQEGAVGRPRGYIPAVAATGIVQEAAVGRPGVSTSRGARAIAQEAAVGRPHAFAHAEFILQEGVVGRPRGYIRAVAAIPIVQEAAVGRPGVSTSRGARAIAQEAAVGRPHAFAHAEFILQEAVVGRPRGYIPAVAAIPIAQESAVGRPRGQTSRGLRPIAQEAAVGRPAVSTSRAARPIAAEQAVGRPGVSTSSAAIPIAQEAAVGRPVALVRRAVRAIAQEAAVGRPAVSTSRAARPIAAEQAVSMPIGERRRIAYGRPLAQEAAVGRPVVLVKRAVRPILAEQVTGRPAAVRFGSGRRLAQENVLGRPRGYIRAVAARTIAQAQAVGRPLGEKVRTTPGIPVVQVMAVGRPRYYRQNLGGEIIMEMAPGRPRGAFPYRNPKREGRAEVQTRQGRYTTAARSERWSVTAIR